jgi:hypothetical protein
MYYIVSEHDDKILDICDNMSSDIIQAAANEFGCAVYAIDGEHSGYSARPNADAAADTRSVA